MNWLPRLLGIKALSDCIGEQSLHIMALQQEILELRNDLVVTFRDEFDPKRRAMSDRLGQKMIEKLKAEDLARRHTKGEL